MGDEGKGRKIMKQTNYLKIAGIVMIVLGALGVIGSLVSVVAPIPEDAIKQMGATANTFKIQMWISLALSVGQIFIGYKVIKKVEQAYLFGTLYILGALMIEQSTALLLTDGATFSPMMLFSLIIPGIILLLLYLGRNEKAGEKVKDSELV